MRARRVLLFRPAPEGGHGSTSRGRRHLPVRSPVAAPTHVVRSFPRAYFGGSLPSVAGGGAPGDRTPSEPDHLLRVCPAVWPLCLPWEV